MAYETIGYTASAVARKGDRETTIQSPPATTTVAANIATLVSDGALPTQAHVTTLNTNWGTFLTSYNAVVAAIALSSDDVIVSFKTSLTTNQRRDALRAVLAQIEGIS